MRGLIMAAQQQSRAGGLILDTYPGAERAYSLRKLKGSAVNCIRVRRSTDNAELDIGFSGNNIDTSALLSFCGAGNGFVRTWYDQSGNDKHFQQTGNDQQMRIVTSGAIEIENNKPIVNGILGTYMNSVPNTSSIGYAIMVSSNNQADTRSTPSIIQADNTITNKFIICLATSDIDAQNRSAKIQDGGSNVIYSEINTNNIQSLTVHSSDSNNYTIRTNGNSQTLGIAAGSNTGNWFITQQFDMYINRLDRAAPINFSGKYQEIIIYNDDKSSEIQGIENDINAYYSIYL